MMGFTNWRVGKPLSRLAALRLALWLGGLSCALGCFAPALASDHHEAVALAGSSTEAVPAEPDCADDCCPPSRDKQDTSGDMKCCPLLGPSVDTVRKASAPASASAVAGHADSALPVVAASAALPSDSQLHLERGPTYLRCRVLRI